MDERLQTIVMDDEARRLGRSALGPALQATRQRTLQLFAAYEAALGPDLRVPCTPELNLPLWELGHLGWFADWWIARNPERERGLQAAPQVPRMPARQAARGVDADALYHSGEVAHDTRWQLTLPGARDTCADLAEQLDDTLRLLAQASDDDTGLYFFRLVLFHEAMHAEAAVYMAQTLGLDPLQADGGALTADAPYSRPPLPVPAQPWTLGWQGPGFAFDNELGAHTVPLQAFEIDAQALSWARFLPFVEQGGYQQREHWSEAGWAWRQQHGALAPRYLRRSAQGWEQNIFGRWQRLDPDATAVHLSAFEAEAWCHWAGRRLPTEAEWEVAALTQPGFAWGSVWEWTGSAFAPYPGFTPHPYRDYSAPWFDGRPVLKGASTATLPLMRHAQYRNYFTPERNDVMAGFRSVALQA